MRLTSVFPIGANNLKNNLQKVQDSYILDGKISEKIFLTQANYDDDSFASFINVYSILKDEIADFMKFLSSKSTESNMLPSAVTKIILCGRCSALPGFMNYIKQNVDIEIVMANVWSNAFSLEYKLPEMKFIDSLDYATAIGLAL